MTSILESFTSMVSPEMLGQVGKVTGVDPALLTKGLSAVGATTMGSLAASTKTTAGAENLMKSLPADDAASSNPMDMLSGLMGSLNGGTGGTSADLANSVLGSGSNAISGTLSKSLGFDIAPLLSLGTPMLLGVLGKTAKSQNLDAAGLAKAIQSESAAFLNDPANKEVAGIVDSALTAGDKASKLRASFTDEEWAKVRKAPMAAVGLVMAASPSGGRGGAAELTAAAKSILNSASAAEPTSLLGTAFGGGPTQAELDALENSSPTKESALASIKVGLAVVKEKDAAAAAAYSTMIANAAKATAEATKEGGFLGFGGTKVSKEEQAALSAITSALA